MIAQNIKRQLLTREEQSTTGIGEGIAIPHAKQKRLNMRLLPLEGQKLVWTMNLLMVSLLIYSL